MALRSQLLAAKMWVAAASAIRRRQPAPPTPPAEEFVILVTTRRDLELLRLKSMDDPSLQQDEAMRRIIENTRKGNEELQRQWVKIRRATMCLACTAVVAIFVWTVPVPPRADTKKKN